jgi:hypothetical protein
MLRKAPPKISDVPKNTHIHASFFCMMIPNIHQIFIVLWFYLCPFMYNVWKVMLDSCTTITITSSWVLGALAIAAGSLLIALLVLLIVRSAFLTHGINYALSLAIRAGSQFMALSFYS